MKSKKLIKLFISLMLVGAIFFILSIYVKSQNIIQLRKSAQEQTILANNEEMYEDEENIAENENSKINPEYIEWYNSTKEERKAKWGELIPPTILTKINNDESAQENLTQERSPNLLRASSSLDNVVTDSYYKLGNLAVENQNGSGWCWNYTSLKTLQTYFQKKGTFYNFAEYHLGYMRYKEFGGWLKLEKRKGDNSYGEAAYHEGGNFETFMRYVGLATWDYEIGQWANVGDITTKGPVTDTNDKNTVYNIEKGENYYFKGKETPEAKVLRTVTFANISKTYTNGRVSGYKNAGNEISESDVYSFRQKVKSQIKTNGGVYTGTNIRDDYFNFNTKALYINNSSIGKNHAVTIVGWDDNYSKTNFLTQPAHNGAWIAMNSWGEEWGNKGLFYISYDDALVEESMYGVVAAKKWTDAPSVTVKYSTTGKTNQDVKVTISSYDKLQGISGWKIDYKNWNMEEKYYDIYTKATTLTKTYKANTTETITIKDESGQTIKQTITINNIDKTEPTVWATAKTSTGSNYTLGNYTNAEYVTLTVNASDDSGIAGYSFNNGAYSTTNTFKVTTTNKVKVMVKDKAGNIKTVYYQVNIDRENPIIRQITKTPNVEWSNKDVTLKVKATSLSGMDKISFNGGYTWVSWGEEDTFSKTFTNSAIFKIQVKDKAGNITDYNNGETLKINIDKNAPTIKIDAKMGVQGTQWVNSSQIGNATNGGAYITIDCSDGNGSGTIDGFLYRKEGWEEDRWIRSTTVDKLGSDLHYYLSKNETVYFKVKDNARNYSEIIQVTINMIDRIEPAISVSKTYSADKKSCNIRILASDSKDSSGIASGIKDYSFDGGKTWETNPIKNYTENKIIETGMLMVRDNAGNESKYNSKVIISEIDVNPIIVEEVKYSTKEPTNKNIVVSIKSNKQIDDSKLNNGWTMSTDDEDEKTITKEYLENTSEIGEEVTLADKNTGATIKQIVLVRNIDKNAPIVNSQDITYIATEESKVRVTIKANETLRPINDTTQGLYTTWKVDENDSTKISAEFKGGKNGKITITDLAGNTAKVPISFTIAGTLPSFEPQVSYRVDGNLIEEEKVTNKSVKAVIETNRSVTISEEKVQDGWTISENGRVVQKIFNDYAIEDITLMDNANTNYKETVSVKANIDKIGPTITGISGNPTKWTKKNAILTINATDEGSSDILEYSFNGGETWTSGNKKTYTQNQDGIKIAVRDEAGNITQYENNIDIKKIDKTLPAISSITKTLSQDNQTVRVTVLAEDNESGLKSYSFNGGNTWTVNNYADTNENRIIEANMIRVRDNADNEATYTEEVLINEIDENKLTVQDIHYSTEKITNGNVKVKIKTNKELKAPLENSGWQLDLDDNKNMTIIKEFTENTDENGESVLLEDANTGTKITQKVIVLNIDKQEPKIKGEIIRSSTQNYVGSVTITIPDIYDEGIADLRDDGLSFSYNEGQTWVENNQCTYTTNGTKKIYIRDAANNILQLSIEINNIDEIGPIIDKIDGYNGDKWHKDSVTLAVTAHDNYELADEAYSFDNGKTYQSSNSITYEESQENIVIVVRDKCGRTTKYNNGEKINLRVDNKNAILNIEGNPTKWVKQASLKAIATDEQSGVLGYSFAGKSYNENDTYTVSKNGNVTIKVKDNVGHITSKTITIKKIDNIKPVIKNIERNISEDKRKIILTIDAEDPEDNFGITSGIAEYSFDGGESWTVNNVMEYSENQEIDTNMIIVKDNAGNLGTYDKKISIVELDKEKLQAEIYYSTNEPTNKTVKVQIRASKKIKSLANEGWQFEDETEKIVSKEYEKNIDELVSLIDANTGESVVQSISIKNIDKESPVVKKEDIKYEVTENNRVKVTVKANEQLRPIENRNQGLWTTWQVDENDSTKISAVYKDGKNGEITVTDLAGNTTQVPIYFRISDTLPEFNANVVYKVENNNIQSASITNKNITAIITVDRKITISDESIQSGWIVSEDHKSVKKTYNNYSIEELTLIDYENNSYKENIQIKANIDKISPSIIAVNGNKSNWTNKNITLTVQAEDEGISNNIFYSFDGGETWSLSNKKTYSQNCEAIKIAVKDEAGNITETQDQVNINKIDKIIPQIKNINKDTEQWTKELNITVEAEDLQSGIYGYSFDNANAIPRVNSEIFLENNSFKLQTNGIIAISVKDNAGNVSKERLLEITNIDNTEPTIREIKTELLEDRKSVLVTVDAIDNQSGIESYSFDGGKTWIEAEQENANKKIFAKNGKIEANTIVLKDKCGNESYYEDEIDITRIITKIEIKKLPNKTNYEKGEDIDLEGGIITVTYDNNETEDISMKNNVIITGYDSEILGEQEVNVIYNGNSTKMRINCVHSIVSIKMEVEEKEIIEGERFKINVLFNPTDTTDDKTLLWNSSDEAIATVDSKGEVTALKEGICKITATTSNGKKAECKLTVTKAPYFEVKEYTIKNNYILDVKPLTKIKDFLKQLDTNIEYRVLDKDKNIINNKDALIGTGMSIELRDGRKFIIIILGDTNGDGIQGKQDLLLIADHVVKKKKLEKEFLIAGNLNNDNTVDISDLSIISGVILK